MAHKNRTNMSPMGSHRDRKFPSRGQHKKPQQVLSIHEAEDRLFDIFRNHDFENVDHMVRSQLVRFYILLMEQQKRENFTRLLTFRDIAIKHFIDSLIVARLTKLTFPLLDMGTGPGFPGIPLKILLGPEPKIILAEGVQKRVEFLKKAREELRLENLDILGKNINNEFMYPVGGVITRAVEDCRNTLANVINCLTVNGKVFLMKGPNVGPEIELAMQEWGHYFELEKNIEYVLPETQHERRLVIFRKIRTMNLDEQNLDLEGDGDED